MLAILPQFGLALFFVGYAQSDESCVQRVRITDQCNEC